MSSEDKGAEWVSNIRAEAETPGTIVIIIGNPRTAILLPEEVIGKTDKEIYTLVCERIVESGRQHDDRNV